MILFKRSQCRLVHSVVVVWPLAALKSDSYYPTFLFGDTSLGFGFGFNVSIWVPALGLSCGLDAITTGMIAGRLIYHHRKQRKLTYGHSTIYLPVVTIFIESAALSLISKMIQISIPYDLGDDPIVVPLCVSHLSTLGLWT